MAESWDPEKIEQFADRTSEAGLHNRDGAIAWRRWALASCLSINGGGAVAVLNLSEIDDNSQTWAIIWFIGGLIASIIYGFVSAAMMSKWGSFFLTSSWEMKKRLFEGSNNERLDISRFERLLRLDRKIQWIQYLALPMFLLGLAIAVEGLR